MKDLVYRRAAVHSSAADFDHCGHLVTWDDPEQFWISGDPGQEWLRFGLGGPCEVRLVRITWVTCPSSVEVQGGAGPEQWATVGTLKAEAGVQEVRLDGLRTDRLRLLFRMAPGERCAVRRVEVLGEGDTPETPSSP